MMSKCGENKKAALGAQPSVSLMFLPHFDILCSLYCTVLYIPTATWNLFVLNDNKATICCSVIDRRRKLQIKMRE